MTGCNSYGAAQGARQRHEEYRVTSVGGCVFNTNRVGALGMIRKQGPIFSGLVRNLHRVSKIVAGAFLFGSAGLAAQGQTAKPAAIPYVRISAEQFGTLPFVSAPSLSPDGTHVVAEGFIDGKEVILVFDLVNEGAKARIIGKPADREIVWTRWAGNGRILISLAEKTVIFGIELYATRLVSLDLATGTQNFVGLKSEGLSGDDVIFVEPQGKFLLLSVQKSIFVYPQVVRVDLNSFKTETVVPAHDNVWNWYADPAGTVRAGMGSAGRKWWLLYRSKDGEKFEKVIRRTERRDSDADVERFIPLNGTNQGYAIANKNTGRFGLYRYDFSGDALGDAVFEHPKVDIDDFDLTPDGNGVLAVHYTDDRARVRWFDPAMQTLQAKLEKTLPGNVTRILSSSLDKSIMLVWSGGASDPGSYFLHDRTRKTLRPLFTPFDKLSGKLLAPVEAVEYAARDGTTIPAYLTKPPAREPKALPLIIMPHGGPFLRDSWDFDIWAQFLANRGYAVLQPNFRGSTGYGREFVEKGMGQWGRGMQDDIDDGVQWLVAKGMVDSKRVCIMGASFGGYAAMWAAVRNPDVYRCAISFAGISDVGAMLRYDRKSFTAPRYFKDWQDRVKGEGDFDLKSVSSLFAISRITIPMLIAHGAKDTNVPLSQSAKFHEALLKAGKSHDYIVYPDEGHGFEKPQNSIDFLKRVEAFLAQHNPA